MADPTDIAIVRSLIPDTEAVFDGHTMLEDSDIENYLTVANGNPLRAAGYACLAISSSEAIISKIIKTQDLSTNGAAVADSLTKKAEALFKRSDADDVAAGLGFFQIIDYGDGWSEYPPELTEYGV